MDVKADQIIVCPEELLICKQSIINKKEIGSNEYFIDIESTNIFNNIFQDDQ